MTENLIFLGSGASVPFGLPTMRGLVDYFENHLERKAKNGSAKEILTLYREIKQNLQKVHDNVDLESIFSILYAIERDTKYSDLPFIFNYIFSKFKGLKNSSIFTNQEIENAAKLLILYKNFVRKECTINHDLYDDDISQIYDGFLKAISFSYDEPFHIYTTNYDRVIETYWEGKEDINDLFKKTGGLEELDVGLLSSAAARIKLVKLHGSLDWFKLTTGKIVRSSDYKRSKIGGSRVEGEQMLYPIQQKDLYRYPWYDIFKQFKIDLSKTRNWIVIGYSFNDEFIRNMFLEMLNQDGQNSRMLIVHPRAKDIIKKFQWESIQKIKPISDKLGPDSTLKEIVKVLRDLGYDLPKGNDAS
jgi:SIR2-like domain